MVFVHGLGEKGFMHSMCLGFKAVGSLTTAILIVGRMVSSKMYINRKKGSLLKMFGVWSLEFNEGDGR